MTGAAIGAMHYVGMAAVRAPAVAMWDWHYVVASAVIGIAAMARRHAAGAAGQELARRCDRRADLHAGDLLHAFHRHGGGDLSGPIPPSSVPDIVVEPTTLAIAVAAVAILIVALGLVGALVDSHLSDRAAEEADRLRDPYRRTGSHPGAAGADLGKPQAGAGRGGRGGQGQIRLPGGDEP